MYWVEFPDLEGCFSRGDSLEDAYNNAKETLGLYLDTSDDINDRKINKPSKVIEVIENNKDKDGLVMVVSYVSINMEKIQK